MFGNDKELQKLLPNSLLVTIIDSNKENNFYETILEQSKKSKWNSRIKFLHLNSIDEVKFKTKSLENDLKISDKGILNLNWLNSMTLEKTSLFIVIYYFNENNQNYQEREIILGKIKQLKKYDSNIQIFFYIVKTNFVQPELNNYIEQMKKDFNINIDIKSKKDFFLYENKNLLLENIINSSIKFYKSKKYEYKKIEEKETNIYIKIKYLIKIGIISHIKKKKIENYKPKYFEKAYKLLKNKESNYEKYYFGDKETVKTNFWEVKSISDWLFFKIIQNKKQTIEEQIKFFNNHLYYFSNYNFYNKNKSEDYFYFYEYYWMFNIYDNFFNFLINNKKNDFDNNNIFNQKLGNFYLFEINNMIRLLKYYKKYLKNINLNNINLEEKEYKIDSIFKENSKYYAKTPKFYFNIDPLNKKKFGFNEEIYIRKFINNYELNIQKLKVILIENYEKKLIKYYSNFLSSNNLNIYIKILNLSIEYNFENIEKYDNNSLNIIINNLHNLITSMDSNKQIIKFIKFYKFFIEQIVNILIYKTNKNNKNFENFNEKIILYENLLKLGMFRELNSNEEEYLNILLNDSFFINENEENNENKNKENEDEKLTKNIIIRTNQNKIKIIKLIRGKIQNNKIINFSYFIKDLEKNPNRNVLDLIEYNFNFKSCINNNNLIKIKEIIFHFTTENISNQRISKSKITKTFLNNQLNNNILSKNNSIDIQYKLFIKNNYSKINLSDVFIKLENTPNYLYNINLNKTNEKTIYIKNLDKKVLDINYNKQIKIGVNEYYNLEFVFNQEKDFDLQIEDVILNLQTSQINQNKIEENSNSNENIINETNEENNIINNNNENNSFKSQIISKNQDLDLKHSKSENLKENKNNQKENKLNKFYIYNKETKQLEKFINHCEIKIKNLEKIKDQNNSTKLSILIRFKKEGEYIIKIKYLYKIIKKEIEDDSLVFAENGIINTKVISTFDVKCEFKINHFIRNLNETIFFTNEKILLNIILTNELDYNIIIKNIENKIINKENKEKIQIENYLDKIINLPNETLKNKILTLFKSNQFIIPLFLIFSEEFQGKFANLNIFWSTDLLNKFNEENNLNIINEKNISFPEIKIKKYEIDINYSYEIKENNLINIKLLINNYTNLLKKIEILHENQSENDDSICLTGNNKKIYILLPKEKKEIIYNLIYLQKGFLKLPSIKMSELNIQNKEKIETLFYIPDIIKIN